jgi:tetratricopeptide (TPR) repeat protein
MGDYSRALTDLNASIGLDPEDADAYSYRGMVWIERGDAKQAIADADAAVRLEPDDHVHQHNRCSVRIRFMIELETALAACNEALRMRPGDIDGLSSRGVVRLKLGQFAAAKADFSDCLARLKAPAEANRDDGERDRVFCLYGRGVARVQGSADMSGEWQAGRTDIAEAAKLRPDVHRTFGAYGLRP